MSLFIGTLAFDGSEAAAQVRIGVLSGSLLAGIGGFVVLRFTNPVGIGGAAYPRPTRQ